MGRVIEYIAGSATNPGSTLTTVTMASGNSATIRGTNTDKKTWLISTNAFCSTAGELRITSPRMHDQVQNIRNRVTAAISSPLIPGWHTIGIAQRLYAQDNLTIQVSGGGGEQDVAGLLIAYDDLDGVAGRFIDNPTLQKSIVNLVTAEVTVTALTNGNWGTAVAINSTNDNLIANTDYAILGGLTDTRGLAIGIQGVDLGNVRLGFPAEPSLRSLTSNWFQALSICYGAPYIPVINSANKAGILIDVNTNQAGGTYIVNLELAQLAPGFTVAPPRPVGANTQPGI